MNKIKVVNKAGNSQIIIKSLKGQQLNENEVYAINSNKVGGLLHLGVVSKGASFTLTYNTSGFMTFKEYLATPLNKERFARILQNILANLKEIERNYFNQQYLLMDLNRVMVNPATQHIYFIYVPIQFFESGTTLREFLLSIIEHASFAPGEDSSYVRDYITILNSGINFSVFDLEEYMNTLLGQKSGAQQKIECPHCKTILKSATAYCTGCGAKMSETPTGGSNAVYDPLRAEPSIQRVAEPVVVPTAVPVAAPVVEPVAPSVSESIRKDNTQGLSDGTTVLGADPGGTTVLGSEELYEPQYPYLIREKNKEKILINKPSFRIGKERKYCDYFVSDNNAVSRSHADIITREKRYYIIDLNSTNKTYVDGRAIPIEREVEIFSGANLRLANEDFVFFIE